MLKVRIPITFKFIASLITAVLFCNIHNSYAQSRILYFKASKAFDISNTTGRGTTPLDTDDAVLFDAGNLQIILVSQAAQVYKITNEELKRSDNGNPYIEYTVSDAYGKKASIIYLQIHESTGTVTTRVMINDYQSSVSVLDGTIRKVF